ncbi:MAG: UDP-N-acetylmuramoyl-L-alanyl-D-glutamate--2,6-diaminopimelate ligase, partial [bacterium]
SHALRLHRVDGLQFHAATFTNLSPEHLDFHRDMDDYREAKATLFTQHLHPSGLAVINTDDEHGRIIYKRLERDRRLSFGLLTAADITAKDYLLSLQGTEFLLSTPDWEWKTHSPLLGEHNLRNLLGAAGTGIALGLPADAIVQGLESVQVIPGRLELVTAHNGARVLVDYAHTPDGLQQVLSTLAALPHRKMITVFGCGGDRDRKKRPVMGRIALQFSDHVIVTSDNPRTEDPMDIIREIKVGMTIGRDRYEVIADRRKAIERGLDLIGDEDVVLVAGKGHETTQTIGTTAYPFDDRVVIRELLAEAE